MNGNLEPEESVMSSDAIINSEVATIEVANQKLAIQQDEDAICAAIKKSDDKKGYDTYSK